MAHVYVILSGLIERISSTLAPGSTGHSPKGRQPVRTLAILTGTAWLVFCAGAPRADAKILDTVEAERGVEETTFVVRFNEPVRYVSHAPKDFGSDVQIQLRVVGAGGTLESRERISRRPTGELPFIDATLENDGPQGPLLTLRFSRKVRFRVVGGGDFRSISVIIPSVAVNRQTSSRRQPQPAPPAPPAVRKAKTPSSRRPPAVNLKYPYAINLMSSVRAIPSSALPEADRIHGYRLYTETIEKGGKTWNRLRLGFFPTKSAADGYLDRQLRAAYPTAWVAKVSVEERRNSAQTAIPVAGAQATDSSTSSARQDTSSSENRMGTLPGISKKRLERVVQEARTAMTAKDYRRAISLYTMLLQLPEHAHRQEAQELLGLARERNGQVAHSIAEYETYLRLYPEGEGAARVQQRLAGLLTARAKPKKGLPNDPAVAGSKAWSPVISGSLSQYFDRDESFTDTQGKIVNQSAIRSDLDITTRVKTEKVDARTRFSGGMRDDVFSDRKAEHEGYVSSLYFDVAGRKLGLSTRLGRQTRSSGGVMGRFDGGLVSYRPVGKMGINLVGGFPVEKTVDFPTGIERFFYGVSTDLGPFYENWSGNIYFIEQTIEGINDRRAVGAEARYVSLKRSAFSLVDYDVGYNSLNTLLFTGNFTFPTKTTASLSLDYRKSPLLTTKNALQGQPVVSIWQMMDLFTENQIRDLAEDRTASSKSVTLGASHPLHEKYQVSGEFRASEVSGTPSSGGVDGTPSTGLEYFGSAQLIASGLFMSSDINIFGISYNYAGNADTLTGTLNSRFPVTRDLRLNPKVRADFRHNKTSDSDRVRVVPTIRLNYRPRRNVNLELQGGGEWINDQLPTGTENNFGYFISIGYRWDFDFQP